MLDPRRSLLLHAEDMPELPRVPEFAGLYQKDWKPRAGQLAMIAGRSGAGKSTFALFWCAKMGLPTLYFSSDMTAAQVSYKLAAMSMERDVDDIEQDWHADPSSRKGTLQSLEGSPFMFSYGSLTLAGIDRTLDAYVELHDAWPEIIVIDNLMDMEGAEADYTAQQGMMQYLHSMKTMTGSTVIVLHHASDKSWDAASDPYAAPGRKEIKNGMSEKPEQVITVSLNPHTNEFRVALVKQRMAKQDPTGNYYGKLLAVPAQSRYERFVEGRPLVQFD